MIVRSVTSAISAMLAVAQEIAANNLAIDDSDVATHDEIGQAGVALNTMKNNLRELIRSIAGTAEHVLHYRWVDANIGAERNTDFLSDLRGC